MQCYNRSEYRRNEYSKRMHGIWNEMGRLNATEQRLVDKKNNILKRRWLPDLDWQKYKETSRILDMVKWGWKVIKIRDGSWDLIMKYTMYL